MILTPDQRLRVFVSSTLGELAEERAAVRAAIESLRLAPVMFEMGARPHPPRALYRAYLDQSHVFVGIYAERYGWIAPGMVVSGLEDEYLLSAGRPRLAYVLDPAPERDDRLQEMLARLQADPTVRGRPYRSAADLAALVAEDLARTLAAGLTMTTAEAERAGATPAPATLPVATTPLVGRERELAEVVELLQRPDVRLVTVTGVGGIGKSRFALEAAHRLAPAFPGGVVLVPLAVVPEPGLVLPSIASQLGVHLDVSGDPVREVTAALAGRPRLLLVLDNAEHVAGAADDLGGLIGFAPEVSLLVTSRTRLRLVAENDYPLPPLSVGAPPPGEGFGGDLDPAAPGPAEQLSDAERLFVERARAARPDLDLSDPAERAAVEEICRRLDGLPLAIELAAARVRLLPPRTLLARLHHRLDLPPARFADLPERQRTLRATLDFSHALLAPPVQDLLAQLATFSGGASLAAVTAVCRVDGDLLDALAVLADHSLVDVDGTVVDAPRFRMLETVREYARERLDASGRAAAVDARHTAWVVDLAERARAALPGPEQDEWVERLELESGNIRIAGSRAYAAGDPATLAHVGFCLWIWLWVAHHAREARVWLQRALHDPQRLDPLTRARVSWTLAAGSFEQGDNQTASELLAQAEEGFAALQDAEGRLLAQFLGASLAPLDGDMDRSVRLFDASSAAFLAAGNVFLASVSASTAGMVCTRQGRPDEAFPRLAQALDLAHRIDNGLLLGQTLVARGFAHLAQGDPDRARADLVAGARHAARRRSPEILAFACDGLAAAWLAAGAPHDPPVRAAALVGAAAGLRDRAGIVPWPVVRPAVTALAAGLRASLGPAAYDPAWAAGHRLGLDGVLALITGEPAAGGVEPVAGPWVNSSDAERKVG